MIHLSNVTLSFGTQKVFDGLDLTIAPSDRIGLVGRNGTGKTTLLKAMAQGLQLDGGSISISGKCRVAYMPQEVVLNSTQSILEEALSAYNIIGPLRQRAHELEGKLKDGDEHVIHEYGEIMEQLGQLNVDFAVRQTKKMLLGLGFKQEQLENPVTSLSVGWQMRIVLAKLLLQDADFYLFDEPTNHLDIVAKDWFLQFLKDAEFGFLIVSHDRYFLDQLCTKIFELDRGKGTLYYGNYQDYEEQKEQGLEQLHAAYEQQQKDIKRKQAWVDRFRAKSSKAKLAKSVEKSLEKIELIELPPDAKSIHFHFGSTQRAGKVVLDVHNLSYAYGAGNPVFEKVSFQIERGQKVAVIAPNGGGKTTLFNVLCGKYKPKTGTVHFGYNVETAIFEQEQHKILDPNKTVLQEVLDNTYNKPEQQIRTFLGSFLFSRDEVIKKTKVLSGGERNRVSMVKVLLQDANFLLLDEPTNHLDIQSKEILYQALKQFDGTVLFVSHDHDFVNKLATRVLELTPQGIYSYFGNYDSFLQQKADREKLLNGSTVQESRSEVSQKNQQQRDKQQQKKELYKIERDIAKLEDQVKRIGASFADLDYGTPAFDAAQEKLAQKEAELKAALENWEALQRGH